MTTNVEGFDRLVEPFRSELLAYCYRMLGTVHDAEDLVQDTYLRAWRAREQYDHTRSSLRTWLYRIATNACLTALKGNGRRPLPSGLVAESEPLAPLVLGDNVPWLQPLPDSLLTGGDPAGAVIDRSSLRLAFAAALQHLSARQRGALILRDVLSFSAAADRCHRVWWPRRTRSRRSCRERTSPGSSPCRTPCWTRAIRPAP